MERAEEPNYQLLAGFMCQAMEELGAKWDDPYDWEYLGLSAVSAIQCHQIGQKKVRRSFKLTALAPQIRRIDCENLSQ
jgi:hypothetical protein